jgi:molybdopterin molybdotransferase
MSATLVDDCFRTETERLTHGEALAILASRVKAVASVESVRTEAAAGRILAERVVAERPVPGHTNAAVDGFAFRATDYDPAHGTTFPVLGRAAAGHTLAAPPPSGAAARILTGAVLPAPCDTIVMQEDVTLEDRRGQTFVRVPAGARAGSNVRHAGEDVAVGDVLFEEGHRLRAQDLAALASVGRANVACRVPLRVAIVSSGDEIVRAGQALGEGQVYDANAPMLHALVAAAGAAPVDLGVWPDQQAEVDARLADAAARFDLIVTSGGASRGDEDHMVRAIERLGSRHLWQLAIKPGRPMSFGQVGRAVVLGLPGNPVAVFVCFSLYARPVLLALGGARWREPRRLLLPAAFHFKGRKKGRREFWRGMLVDGEQGDGAPICAVDKFPRDGSGLITSLRLADGLIEIPEEAGDVEPGDHVRFIPLSELGL